MIGVELFAPHPLAVIGASIDTIPVVIEIPNRQAYDLSRAHVDLINSLRLD